MNDAAGLGLRLEAGDDGVLVLTFDVPGAKLNTLSRAMLARFEELLAELESEERSARALLLTSAKPDNFVAGADINDFVRIRSAREGEELSRAGQRLLDRLAALPIPTLAAVHGSCLGGGVETILACRYRLASADPVTAFGLPEVQLGLIPGAGGSQRLPRLVGLAAALDLIVTGRKIRPERALRIGLVDEVVPAPLLLEIARRRALALADGSLKPRRRGIPWRERLARALIFRKARASVLAKTGGHYPAALAAIDVVREGTATTLAEGLKLEARRFGELAVTDVSRALVSLFFATREIKKDTGVPSGTPALEVRKLGVLGAGLMGAGIAAAAAEAGIAVRLRDTSHEALGRGLRAARAIFEERRRRRREDQREVERRLTRIAPTLDWSGFRRAPLVIEAVFEDLELKRRVLAETEAVIADDAVFATNTSALPLIEITRAARRPERVVGMHFFSPVHRMPLLEVVVGAGTRPEAAATAVAFGQRLGKHVIVVGDGAGFYTTRTLAAYLNEATRLLEEGAAVEDVDAALVSFGFPVGPLALLDEVGIDVGAKVSAIMQRHLGERLAAPAAMARVLDDGRHGRKNGRGFYDYRGRSRRVDTSVYDLLPSGRDRRRFDPHDIQDRLVFAFVNEAARCLEEGILRSARDGDVGAVFGLGFPPFLGGPLRYLDTLGARYATEVLGRLVEKHGSRFRPAALLSDLAARGGHFHP